MALQISMEDPFTGAMLDAAYVRITAASLDLAAKRAALHVLVYHDKASRISERQYLLFESYVWGLPGSPGWLDSFGKEAWAMPTYEELFGDASTRDTNIIQIGYEALKSSVPKYAEAQDV